VVELRQFGHGDRGDLVDQALDAHLPALVQRVPVLVVVAGPLAEDRGPAADLVGVGDRVGRDVDPPVDDAVLDAERGGEEEHPRGVGPDRAVRDLGRDRVEGRHRLGEVHGVVEPEALVVVRLEPGEVGVHGPPALGARGVRDLRRKREPGTALGGYQGGRPPEASRVRVHRALLVTPLCAGPHRRRWHSGTAGSMAYATISPGQILGHAPKQAHGSFVVRPCRHRDLPDRVRELPPEGGLMEGTRSGLPLLAASARPRAGVLLAGCAVLVTVLGAVFARQNMADRFDHAVDAPVITGFAGHPTLALWLAFPGTTKPAVALSVVIAAACLLAGRLAGALLAVAAVPVAVGLCELLIKPLV